MRRYLGEFEEQTFTQIIFPHKNTDWVEYLEEVQKTFVNIINAIRIYQPCVVVCHNIQEVQQHFDNFENLVFREYICDDTWARDCSAISILEGSNVELLDFTFNGWGGKFDATKDNALTQHLYEDAKKCDLILEGGAIESNGGKLLLTTSHAMLNKNRNKNLTKEQITHKLKECLGVQEVLYLHHGYLAGDDTDSHIDTLARFIDEKTIMYVECQNKEDEHFEELQKMKQELEYFAQRYALQLIALPMTSPIYFEDERLPATYANFLFVNGAVLVPIYGVKEDEKAPEIFTNTFPKRDIISIDCSTLIKQHGSLHCVTMNFAQALSHQNNF